MKNKLEIGMKIGFGIVFIWLMSIIIGCTEDPIDEVMEPEEVVVVVEEPTDASGSDTTQQDQADDAVWGEWTNWAVWAQDGPEFETRIERRHRDCEIIVNGVADATPPVCDGDNFEEREVDNPNYGIIHLYGSENTNMGVTIEPSEHTYILHQSWSTSNLTIGAGTTLEAGDTFEFPHRITAIGTDVNPITFIGFDRDELLEALTDTSSYVIIDDELIERVEFADDFFYNHRGTYYRFSWSSTRGGNYWLRIRISDSGDFFYDALNWQQSANNAMTNHGNYWSWNEPCWYIDDDLYIEDKKVKGTHYTEVTNWSLDDTNYNNKDRVRWVGTHPELGAVCFEVRAWMSGLTKKVGFDFYVLGKDFSPSWASDNIADAEQKWVYPNLSMDDTNFCN